MTRYAENTQVPTSKSRDEIERTLKRYGATGFLYGWEGSLVLLGFKMSGRQIKFRLPMPDPNAKEFTMTANYRERSESAAQAAYEQACRQRWRALALVIKAKLEAVESGITTFDDEFLSNILLPNGQTSGDWLKPQIEIAYERGNMPRLLPEG